MSYLSNQPRSGIVADSTNRFLYWTVTIAMEILTAFLIVLSTFLVMEGVAWYLQVCGLTLELKFFAVRDNRLISSSDVGHRLELNRTHSPPLTF